MKRPRNGPRIMCIQRLLSQESELKTEGLRLWKGKKIWAMLKGLDRQLKWPKKHLQRHWMLLETVWAIFQVLMIRRMGNMRQMMKKVQGWSCRGKMLNPAGWWVQSPKWSSKAWRVYCRSGWGLTDWRNQDTGTRRNDSVREIWSTGRLIWWFR